jgi:hypothetical protein
MADQWTVKQLTEALKSFPADAKVYYEMGPNGPGAIGKALRSALGARTANWECCWTVRFCFVPSRILRRIGHGCFVYVGTGRAVAAATIFLRC